ncbi:hypothetical protein TNCV_2093121 [Trichonephila clavipes]|nr:hypothetical protein TNCV_2093121 [Trichonephila clavipes]
MCHWFVISVPVPLKVRRVEMHVKSAETRRSHVGVVWKLGVIEMQNYEVHLKTCGFPYLQGLRNIIFQHDNAKTLNMSSACASGLLFTKSIVQDITHPETSIMFDGI